MATQPEPEPEPQPEPEPEPQPHPTPQPESAECVLLCAPDGRRPLAGWGPTLYTNFVLAEAGACVLAESTRLGLVAHASDALRRVERHAELYAAAVAAATGTDGGGGRCSGKPQLAPTPLRLRLPSAVAAAVAARQALGDLLDVTAEGDSVEALMAALAASTPPAAVGDGERLCIMVHVWGGARMSSKAKHKLAARCAVALGLAHVPRVGADAAAPTDALCICMGVSQADGSSWWCFGRRQPAASAFVHGLQRFDVGDRPLLGDAPTRPPLALAMGNLAQLQPGQLAMDPFVGSGAVLLAAAALGAQTFGVDNDPALLYGSSARGRGPGAAGCDTASAEGDDMKVCVFSNFTQLGLPRPDLLCADMLLQQPPLHCECGAFLAPTALAAAQGGRSSMVRGVSGGAVDVIVTDPPFGFRYPPWRMGVR
jgi:hypothetical protein